MIGPGIRPPTVLADLVGGVRWVWVLVCRRLAGCYPWSKAPYCSPCLFFTTCEIQRAVRNCCSINIFRWYRSVHINGIDPSPITFLIHSGQGKNNLSSLSASQQPFLSALALYCWQFHQFHIFYQWSYTAQCSRSQLKVA